jgi:peptidyl-prolyl cis-trans isomerase C
LIRSAPDAAPEEKEAARKKAGEIQVRCAAGEDFAALAAEFSEDPGSKEDGGDLGFFTREQMVAPFSEAAFALQPGQVSGVVETRFGYHVIKLAERKEASKQSLDDVREQIEGFLSSRALDQAVQSRLDELKAEARIDVVAPHL